VSYNWDNDKQLIMNQYSRHLERVGHVPQRQDLMSLGSFVVENLSAFTRVSRDLIASIDGLDDQQFRTWCNFVSTNSEEYRKLLQEVTSAGSRDFIAPKDQPPRKRARPGHRLL
jgi:hypothetical protein